MSASEPDDFHLDSRLAQAVSSYWAVLENQGENQGADSGQKDYGDRSKVTGGKQMDAFAELLKDLLERCGIERSAMYCGRSTSLPGFYRPTKDWDLVVVVDGNLLIALELKSLPTSFGNNSNNRVEEALGSASDLWKAYQKRTYGKSQRPWLGYLMLICDEKSSSSPVAVPERHFAIRKEFRDVSYGTVSRLGGKPVKASVPYLRRMELFCEKIKQEGLYDSSCFLVTDHAQGPSGYYREPSGELAFREFVGSMMGKALGYVQAKKL
jgi:hypothetical protein